ncbi:MAG: hypothetical protein ACKOBM_04045, partial [Gammaproteobacteria bacterium]
MCRNFALESGLLAVSRSEPRVKAVQFGRDALELGAGGLLPRNVGRPARVAVPLVTPVTLMLLGLLVILTSAVPAAWGAEPTAGGPSDSARQETARAELERITTELNGLDAWFGSADRKQ